MIFSMRQLVVFEAVARNLSVTKAAKELFLTQPAVSIQIRLMEEAAGLPLYEQIGRRIFLTEAGRETYRAGQEVMARMKALEMSYADLKGRIEGELKISVVSAANYFAPHLLGEFLRRYPKVQVKLQVENREAVLYRLMENLDDLVVMGQAPDELAVEAFPFLDNPLVMVAPPDHPLAAAKAISLAQAAQQAFLVREPGSGTRKAMEQLFQTHKLPLKVAMELGSSEAIKHGVMAGLGLSVLSADNLSMELAEGYLTALDVEGFPLRRHWYAVLLKGKQPSLVARTFLEFIQKESGHILERAGRKSHRGAASLPQTKG